MTYTIRLEGDTDTVWLRPAQPTGGDPIVCKGETVSSASPREAKQSRPGRSGVDDRTAFHDEATFQANLIVRDGDGLTRHQWVDRLRGMLRPNQRPWLVMQRDGWATERWSSVRGSSLTAPIDKVSGQRVETSLQLELPDGVWSSPGQSTDTIRPGSTGAGLTFPVTFPAEFTSWSSGATKIIVVGPDEYGIAPTALVMRLYGGCTDPIVTNQTTGQIFELDGVTLNAGDYLDIDMGAKTVLLNGNSTLSYYSKINFSTSSWWELQPGENLLSLGAATSDSSCELDLAWFINYAI